jgi:hypothetical protein
MENQETIVPVNSETDSVPQVKNKGGRPTKLTEEITENLCLGIKNGLPVMVVCHKLRISTGTFYRWMARHQGFAADIKAAQAEFQEQMSGVILRAALGAKSSLVDGKGKIGQWQAAAWQLERQFPEIWGRREAHELTGPNGGPIQLEHGVGESIKRGLLACRKPPAQRTVEIKQLPNGKEKGPATEG